MKGSIRKRCLKRALALVSTLAMMGSFSYATGASEILSYNVISVAATEGGEGESPGTPEIKESSRIDVEITNQFDFKQDVECTVKVYTGNPEDDLIGRSVEISKEKFSKKTVSTPYITAGEYTVEVNVPGFQAFSQKISVAEEKICKLKVSIGFDEIYSYVEDYAKDENNQEELISYDGKPILETSEHPGGMRVGDINGDGQINFEDLELLLDAISKSENNRNGIHTDLNYDGATNLMDLTFFTMGIIDTKDYHTDATPIEITSDKFYQADVDEENSTKTKDGKTLLDFINTDGESDEDKEPFEVQLEEGKTTDIDTSFKEAKILQDITFENTNVQAGAIVIIDKDGNEVEYDFGGYKGNTDNKEPKEPAVDPDANKDPKDPVVDSDANKEPKDPVIDPDADKDPKDPVDDPDNENDDVHYITLEEVMAVTNNTPIPDIATFADNPEDSDKNPDSETPKNPEVTLDANGNIALNLGAQIAVKKITLKISAVSKNTNLAQIGTVEFLNGMEKFISDPEIDFPTEVTVKQGSNEDTYANIVINWKEPKNSSGKYEVEVSTSPKTNPDGSFVSVIPKLNEQVVETTGSTLSLQSQHGNFKLIQLNKTYYVHVRSISANEDENDYKSKWSDTAKVTTVPKSAPDQVFNITAKGGFQSMELSWDADKTNSATGYILYYRNITAGETEFKQKDVGLTTKHTLIGLVGEKNAEGKEVAQEYEFDAVAYNNVGSSNNAPTKAKGTTTIDNVPVILPRYGAINCSDDGQLGDAHIVNVTRHGGDMTNCDSDWGVVDGDQKTYYKQEGRNDNGITYEFDDEYTINYMYMVPIVENQNFWKTTITAWDAAGNVQQYSGYAGESKPRDDNKKLYFRMDIPTVKAKKIKVQFNLYPDNENFVAYSEIAFYNDPLMEEIMGLYADELHTVLKDNVTQEMIDKLRERVDLPDSRNGEANPKKDLHKAELDTAEKLLNAKTINPPVEIHNGITTNDPVGYKENEIVYNPSRNYMGLNAWQPLGVTVGGNTDITVYVGGKNKKYNQNNKNTGDNTPLKLIVTQYNSESGKLTPQSYDLKVGANTFTIANNDIAGAESGGALYVQYQGTANDESECYSVRVEGGTAVPILDLYNVTDETERLEKAADYIEALDKYVAGMEELHNKIHLGATYGTDKKNNTAINMEYKKELCVLGATDILGNTMMYSLPAPQILAGLGKGSTGARAVKLIQSMDAIEDMVKFFYQHKGMSYDAKYAVDRIPNQHLNIRYQRMFQGAFMYAAGNHIGIQWGSVPDMVAKSGVESDENGKYVSGNYFGWGIAHEIGHDINDSNYVVPEITNNYFAMLAQSQDKNDGSRLNYNNIFKKVTSGTKGSADQGTQLGMYWQLHLAYDKDFNYKTYSTSEDIFKNLFYARMDTYSRNPAKAPAYKGTTLKLDGGTDQNLMRLACAAADRNILEFFIRWGKTPDIETLKYAANFEPETRAIMYANEDSRVYAMSGKSSLENDADVINNVTLKVGKGTQANKVDISIDVSDKIKPADILGYEIIRCTISGGDVKETPVAFTKTPNYTDVITSFNNRTVSYKVALVDQYLNRSEVVTTDMIKIEHDGTLDKSGWSVATTENTETNTEAKTEETTVPTTDIFKSAVEEKKATADTFDCHPTIIDPITKAFDSDFNTVYNAEVIGEPSIYINLGQSVTISGLKYSTNKVTAKEIGYTISVKVPENESNPNSPVIWRNAEEGTFEFDKNGTAVVYFTNEQKKYLSTYDTAEVKLQITGMDGETISISEIDILGVTGDNVDFRRDGNKGATAFGKLSEDYRYSSGKNDYIPAGSYVFIGSYKGNAAYNAVILFDEKGNIVGTPDLTKVKEETENNIPAETSPELEQALNDISGNSEEKEKATSEIFKKDEEGKSQQLILADIPDGQLITDVKDGTFIYWVTPEDAENMIWPEKVRVELYRVNDAVEMTGQRIVSDSLFEEVPDKELMTPISINGDRKFTTE
ncbi:MAG: M60 family metallopeptidase [Ruminococcus sp.]|nr:M60 family metallopeptidase [Ruminococcus sp.]